MDSRIVSRELRAVVRPVLKDAGFTVFRGRDAWRSLGDQTWVVDFQSFNSHVAAGVGCTTYSFCVRLGMHLSGDERAPGRADAVLPKEYESSFRFTGLKRLSQPWFHPWDDPRPTDRRDVWFVHEDGSNLAEVVRDARDVIATSGLRQLERPALRILRAVRLREALAASRHRRRHRGHPVGSVRLPALATGRRDPRASPRPRSSCRSGHGAPRRPPR